MLGLHAHVFALKMKYQHGRHPHRQQLETKRRAELPRVSAERDCAVTSRCPFEAPASLALEVDEESQRDRPSETPVSFHSTDTEVGAQPELFIFNELCALKEDPGPCRALRDKYFFNVDTGRCELFEYGGCGGNANNFETLEACRETCLVSEDKNPCHLPEAEGPCRGLVTRYFFNSSSQQCKRFYYGGCFGNANNFRSMAECQAKCGQQESVQVQTGAGEIVDVPSTALTGQQTVNMAVTQTSDTDPDHSQDAKLSDVCSAPVERGTCDGSLRRFAYHPKAKRCHEFLYSGCGGNNNNFKHRRQCIRKCMKSQKDRGMKMIRIRKKNIPSILHGSV